tara:strand:+ start:923 stop:2458 length:1536 start_codon:yes stop_codon:yes gene_type:complete
MNTGPKLTNEDLVFGYDTGYGIADNGVETRFYKGEPTSNILPSPEVNGRFTTGNGWRSYNTNQYNSNTYFSIGTVSGVSNNIVTLSSVGRTIRSFDVLRAQTTGGGITAGTDYVVKKISSSTFSLHAYNNSQDGSQGYINPSTGFFKVHDAYANDTRVSINATSFPTMWWGAPHLPNSALIKEIVPNGGYVKGTNCMRFHIYRGDNVRDGMAYNVYTPVTQGDVITVSYWVRPVNSFAHGKTWNYQTYFGSGNSNSYFNTTLNSTGEWQHVVHQWTASVTFNFYSYWFPQASTDIWAMDMADLQVEVNKGHATPFTLTSRSNTESLIDLTKSTDLTLSAMTYDSTGQPDYDGTDDYINLGDYTPIRLGTNFTIECVVKPEEDKWMYFFHKGYGSNNSLAWGRHSSGDDWFFSTMIGGSYQNSYMGTATLNKHCHLVATYDGANLRLYENGVLKVTSAKTHDMLTSSASAGIGGPDRYWNGKIPVTKIYSKVLTTEEVVSNFNAYKNRFDIQ